MFKILVVEEDKEINRQICSFLNQNGYIATTCSNADSVCEEIIGNSYDLIISDTIKSDSSGFDFINDVHRINQNIPVLFLAESNNFPAENQTFRAGNDDYILKPINMDEMFMRIGEILRKAKNVSTNKLTIGGFIMNSDERKATFNGKEIPLKQREFDLLFKLLSNPDKTFTRSQLMNEFWDSGSESGKRTVDVCMAKLRAKLSVCNSFDIITIYGAGYQAVIK